MINDAGKQGVNAPPPVFYFSKGLRARSARSRVKELFSDSPTVAVSPSPHHRRTLYGAVDSGDLNEPIADAVRGILDGHIVTERGEGRRRPAWAKVING